MDEPFASEDSEQHLWENDASYMVAVSPKLFENDRIRLKIVLGSRVRAQLYSLPAPDRDINDSGIDNAPLGMLPDSERMRQQQNRFMSPQDVAFWALNSLDNVGWKGMLGVFALAAGLYTAITRPRARTTRFW